MGEVEFELMLDVVREAFAPEPQDDAMVRIFPTHVYSTCVSPPEAANDNQSADWPLIPFPDGWHAAC